MHHALYKGGVAVITGAAAGIGHAIAHQLARQQMQLVLIDRDAAALAASSATLKDAFPGLVCHEIAGDIADPATIEAAHAAAVKLGQLAVLVNNAAILKPCGGPRGQAEHWQRMMEVNFWSVLALQQRFVDTMIAQASPAAIVNLGSKEGITTPPGNAAYAVSKAAVRVLTEQLAHELRERVQERISAHLLIPGYTFTPMNFPDAPAGSPRPAAPWSAAQVAQRLIDGMDAGDFYIFCEDNEVTWDVDQRRLQWSADDMILNRPALSRWHPVWREQAAQFITKA